MYWIGWDVLTAPAAVVAVVTNVVLVLALWSAGDEDDSGEEEDPLTRIRRRTAEDR